MENLTLDDIVIVATKTECAPAVLAYTPLRRYYTLAILVLAYACAYLDRSVIGVVLPQLKLEFHLRDSGLGFLSGFAFAIFFVVFGLPMAMWADRGTRRKVIAISIALWSAMTALCGLAGNFVTLAMARFGVGIGEAGLSPPAHSLLSDLFPPKERATALSIYMVGIYLGIFIGLAYGGYLAQHYGWRTTFLVFSLPGLVVAALVMLFVPEPPRGHSDGPGFDDRYRNFGEVLQYLWNTKGLRYTLLSITLCSLVTQAQGAWLPSILMRSHGMTLAQAGLLLGVAGGIGGAIGTLLGGRLSDYFAQRDTRWRLWIVTVAFFILPFSMLTFLYAQSRVLVAGAVVMSAMLAAIHLGPTGAVTQNLTPLRMRARAVAVTLFLITMVGGGAGPLMVGMLSDYFRPEFGANSLRAALTTLVVFAVATAAMYFVAGCHLPRTTHSPSSTQPPEFP